MECACTVGMRRERQSGTHRLHFEPGTDGASGSHAPAAPSENDVFLPSRPPRKWESLSRAAGQAALARTLSAAGSVAEEGEYPRSMTEKEKETFKILLPRLDLEKAVVSGPATPDYNCISWTVGETKRWYWPPRMFSGALEADAFRWFYAMRGFEPSNAAEGEIALLKTFYGFTHGSVKGAGHGPRWESKCGELERIQHDLSELEGSSYGSVDCYYRKTEKPAGVAAVPAGELSDVDLSLPVKAEGVDPAVRARFDGLYATWQNFRKNPVVMRHPDPSMHCRTASFEEIAAMGRDAVPLLMEKMGGGDFLCLQAVEAIIAASPDDPELQRLALAGSERMASEQEMAARTVLRWVASK